MEVILFKSRTWEKDLELRVEQSIAGTCMRCSNFADVVLFSKNRNGSLVRLMRVCKEVIFITYNVKYWQLRCPPVSFERLRRCSGITPISRITRIEIDAIPACQNVTWVHLLLQRKQPVVVCCAPECTRRVVLEDIGFVLVCSTVGRYTSQNFGNVVCGLEGVVDGGCVGVVGESD